MTPTRGKGRPTNPLLAAIEARAKAVIAPDGILSPCENYERRLVRYAELDAKRPDRSPRRRLRPAR